MVNLFTNEKETRRAIKAAVDKYNEIFFTSMGVFRDQWFVHGAPFTEFTAF